MASDELGQQLKGLFRKGADGDRLALGKLLTLVENNLLKAATFLASLATNSTSIRVGITGPPGAGKSSLINLFIEHCRKKDWRVAVIAVDPSSPFSGGAILGDRIRMNQHSQDENVFIRSLGSRGGFGGVSAGAGAMATVLEAAGFDVVVIATVGVGQTELQIMNLADATTVVLVPESGDVIQTMKAGILEIADLFVVNKCDRPGAETLAHELHALVEQEGERKRPVLLTSAISKQGVDDWAGLMIKSGEAQRAARRSSQERRRGELLNLVLGAVDQRLRRELSNEPIDNVYKAFSRFKP
jgi:LAO/AO transport system kinase